jgi:hypothetical protein
MCHRVSRAARHKSFRWAPIAKPLRGKVREAVEYIDGKLEGIDLNKVVPITDVMKAIEVPNRSNYNRTIAGHHQFQEALKERDIIVVAENRYNSGYQRTAF